MQNLFTTVLYESARDACASAPSTLYQRHAIRTTSFSFVDLFPSTLCDICWTASAVPVVTDPKHSISVHGHAVSRSLAGTDADLFDSRERIIESCEQCQQAEPELCDVLVLAAARACAVASLPAAACGTADAVRFVLTASTSEPQRHVRHAHARGLFAVSDQLGNDHARSRTIGHAGIRAVRVLERTASRWVARAEHVRPGPYTP